MRSKIDPFATLKSWHLEHKQHRRTLIIQGPLKKWYMEQKAPLKRKGCIKIDTIPKFPLDI